MCLSGSSFTAASGPVLNPFDMTRSAGGSSNGSAVLVGHLFILLSVELDTFHTVARCLSVLLSVCLAYWFSHTPVTPVLCDRRSMSSNSASFYFF